ncbi:hypothetical protein FQR65_LT08147 [Abscondita terminalis]|nr:hypothetical protein FQR65_LT08147 [Abscondita terminalis]
MGTIAAMIKTVIVACALSAISIQCEFPPAVLSSFLQGLHDTCTQAIGVSDDEIKNYQLTTDSSSKMKCYLLCILIESKWGNPDGTLDYDYVVENVHESVRDIVMPLVEKCRDTPKMEDECETAYALNLCVYKQDPEV